MLEKTAAGLEPCGQLLPRVSHPFRSKRLLHTAFWQHGAADVEVSNAWQSLMHGVCDSSGTDLAPAEPRAPILRASTFLDFLYPNASVAFMRRSHPCPVQSNAKVSPRLYSSSASPPSSGPENDAPSPESAARLITSEPQPVADRSTVQDPLREPGLEHIEALVMYLTRDNPQDADKVWHHYSSLDEQSKNIYMAQTLFFLSKTGSISDSWKISELFKTMDERRWDSFSWVAGLTAELNLQNEAQALDIFAKGLPRPDIDDRALITALDLVLFYALKSTTRQFLTKVWAHYSEMARRLDFDGVIRHLDRLASVPKLPERILELQAYFKGKKDVPGINVLKTVLVCRACVSCTDDQAMPLLSMVNDPVAYEDFLHWRCDFGRRKIVWEVFQAYRRHPSAHPSHAALHAAFVALSHKDLITPNRLRSIEGLWQDWHIFHTQPTIRAYQRFMSFYAGRGEKEKVYQLWTEYIERYQSENVLALDDTFTHLLHVHAVRGEVDEVRRIFEDIRTKFGIEPNTPCWNILLNVHVKANDYDGAIETFDALSERVTPDKYSYATLMAMTAARGDLGLTVDLYRRARRKLDPSPAILHALVRAYCENDCFQEAEDVCHRAATRGIRTTQLWNEVLQTYALRRDLVSVNRLLAAMTAKKIPFNGYTYEALLLALSFCRQPHHALHLLSVGIKEKEFRVTVNHFHIVMGAFIKGGDPQVAFRLHRLMQECGFGKSAKSVLQLATAFSQWEKLPMNRRLGMTSKQLLGSALREFYKFYNKGDDDKKAHGMSVFSRSVRSGAVAFQFGRMAYLFTQLQDFTTVQELREVYREMAGPETKPEDVRLLNSLMLASWHEKKYDNVTELWKTIFEVAKEAGRSADWSPEFSTAPMSKISPQYRYILSDGLKVMQELLVLQNDLPKLQELIQLVHAEGFLMDSKNWNLHVQCLVRLKAYKEAFEVCEKWLMPNWAGFSVARQRANMKNALPLDQRRKGLSPRYLRPIAQTFYYLVRAYLDLDKLSPWSADAGRMLKDLPREAPMAYRAVMSMTLLNTDLEKEILHKQEPSVLSRALEDAEYPDGDDGTDPGPGEQASISGEDASEKQGYALEKERYALEKEYAAEKGEYAPEKEEHASEKEEHASEKEEHASEKEEHASEKEEHASGKGDRASEKEEHASGKEEHASEKEEHASEKEEHASGKGDRASEKEEHALEREERTSIEKS